jgi:recombination protein RecR
VKFPDIEKLCRRVRTGGLREVIIAMSADLDGQTTTFFVHDHLKNLADKITTLSRGMPAGGELDYLDDGTIITAFAQRRNI